MKDFLGVELAIGDPVIVCVPHGKNAGASLTKARVIGFTSNFVRIEGDHFYDWRNSTHTSLKEPLKMVKVTQD